VKYADQTEADFATFRKALRRDLLKRVMRGRAASS